MKNQDASCWLREAKFGMFIHWGLYASKHPAHWKPVSMPAQGEWIMYTAGVPFSEYSELAKTFNPVWFDADEWVKLAADAGMKYLVYTAKHHDGFAMYKSFHPYNIVDAIPFGRDPLAELADACRKYGIRLCIYYSQALDWEYPGAPRYNETADPVAVQHYLDEKSFPQVRELLSNYGPVGLMWFDMPYSMTHEQSWALRHLVKSLQPDCLINSRILHGAHDYGSLGDNMTPSARLTEFQECPGTLNDTWGYLPHDVNWKKPEAVVNQLSALASCNANYLLNVGPDGTGLIPPAAAAILREVGSWLAVNGESIYKSEASPFSTAFDWGYVTAKENCLYLHVKNYTERLVLRGLQNPAIDAVALNRCPTPVKFKSSKNLIGYDVEITLPASFDNNSINVVKLTFSACPEVAAGLFQQPDGTLRLPAASAVLGGVGINAQMQITENWTEPGQSLEWEFTLLDPGKFDIFINTVNIPHISRVSKWIGGHEMNIDCGENHLAFRLELTASPDMPLAQYHASGISLSGTLFFSAAGTYRLRLSLSSMNQAAPWGIGLAELYAVPQVKNI
jgi:alpha-L-fucosidase